MWCHLTPPKGPFKPQPLWGCLQLKQGQPEGLGIGARRPLQRMDSRGPGQTSPLGAPLGAAAQCGAKIAPSVVSRPVLNPALAPLGQVPWGSSYLLMEPLFSHLYSGAVPDPPQDSWEGSVEQQEFGSRHGARRTVGSGGCVGWASGCEAAYKSLERARRAGSSPCVTSGAGSPGKSLEQAPGRGR